MIAHFGGSSQGSNLIEVARMGLVPTAALVLILPMKFPDCLAKIALTNKKGPSVTVPESFPATN